MAGTLRNLRSVVNAECVTHYAMPLGMDSLDTPGRRLKWAREKNSAYKSPTEAADAFGWPKSTYYGHENGDRIPKRDTAKKYAKAYKVPWSWILDGGPLPGAGGIPQAPDIPITTAGRRLQGIRFALCPDLPARIGVSSEIAWAALVNRPGSLPSQLAQQVAEITELPLGYVEDGDTSGLTREQAATLLAEALRDDATMSSQGVPPKPARASSLADRAGGQRRS